MSVKGINVCIYGLNRSLGTTVYSIKKKILQPVVSIADEAHFYAAFNVTATGDFSSQRSGERLAHIGDDQKDLLPEFNIQLVDQDDFDSQFDLAEVLTNGDHYQDNGGSVLNMMRALNALKICYNSIPLNARDSFPTIFLRPDLDIIDDIDLEFLLSFAKDSSVLVPGWQFFGGVNDRFAIAAPGNPSAVYANRISTVFQYLSLTDRSFHSENYLFDVLTLRRLKILPIVQTRFVRVRAGQSFHPETIQQEHLQPAASADSWSLLTNQLMTMHRRLREAGDRINLLKEEQVILGQKVESLEGILQEFKQKVKRLRVKLKNLKKLLA